MASRLSIYHPQGRIEFGERPFGKDVANRDLFRALVQHGAFEQIDILTHGAVAAEAMAGELLQGRPSATRIAFGHILSMKPAVEAGTLLRGKADLTSLAWLRRRAAYDGAFSLVGMIHTLAPPIVRDYLAGAATSPIQPWDALICTSPAVQQAMEQLYDEWGGFLADRFGGAQRPRPHLPLVPLGVDVSAIAAAADDGEARSAVRAEFGLAADDVMILWVGRLSFFEKAFPQPMFRAVELAATMTGAKLQFVLAGWFPNGDQDRARYEAAAKAYAPNCTVRFVSGDDRGHIGQLWAAADVFISLVDNIQETFGITPVEAMAAGLPVVASDWDGYRYTVSDGETGFLIPTLGAPAGRYGYAMASRHTLLMDTYQTYVGTLAQYTAVHVGKAAEAIAALVRDPALRRRMGAAGRARARSMFDWPVVVAELKRLFDDLAAMRPRSPPPAPPPWRLNPVRGDPFHDFAGFATGVLRPDTPLKLAVGAGPEDLKRTEGVIFDQYAYAWRASMAECAAILDLVAKGEVSTVGGLLARFAPGKSWSIEFAVMWMMKLGILDWL